MIRQYFFNNLFFNDHFFFFFLRLEVRCSRSNLIRPQILFTHEIPKFFILRKSSALSSVSLWSRYSFDISSTKEVLGGFGFGEELNDGLVVGEHLSTTHEPERLLTCIKLCSYWSVLLLNFLNLRSWQILNWFFRLRTEFGLSLHDPLLHLHTLLLTLLHTFNNILVRHFFFGARSAKTLQIVIKSFFANALLAIFYGFVVEV